MKEVKHPRRFTQPVEHQADDHLYYTTGWFVKMWVDLHRPRLPHRLLDAGAADGRLGRAFGAKWMVDTVPRHPAVLQRDFLQMTRDDFGGGDISVVENPPFRMAKQFVQHALVLAGEQGDVSAVLRTGTQQQVSWPVHAFKSLLPQHRVQFEVEAAYAEYLIEKAARESAATGKKVKASVQRCDCPTGWRLGSPGDDHGVFMFDNLGGSRCDTRYVDVTGYMRDHAEI